MRKTIIFAERHRPDARGSGFVDGKVAVKFGLSHVRTTSALKALNFEAM